MTTHYMKLARPSFQKMVDGFKIIESRLYDEKRQKINSGDLVKFTRSDDPTKSILTQVEKLYKYSTFDDLFSAFPPQYFGGTSREELFTEIRGFYSEDEEKRYGVVGIKIKLA